MRTACLSTPVQKLRTPENRLKRASQYSSEVSTKHHADSAVIAVYGFDGPISSW